MSNNLKLKLYRFKKGLINTITKPWKYPYLFIHVGLTYYLLIKITEIDFGEHLIRLILKYLIIAIIVVLAIITFIDLLYRIGTPFGTKKIHQNLYKIGLKNSIGEIPILIDKSKLKNKRAYNYVFMNNGISLDDFEKKRARIEATLNIKIFEIKLLHGQSKTMIIATKGNEQLHHVIDWNDDYLSHDDFVLVMGESMTEQLTIDISRIPHILIGGASGSGKSVLLKLLLKQCVNKGADIYLADFKGGIDFPKIWHEKCNLVITLDELTYTLENIIFTLETRKQKFYETECSNIQEYNEKVGSLSRVIFACDEIAQVLDKTGVSKEHKEKIQIVEGYLATISQLGRAFGIHLILATQRPDANILNGQIKANIGYRICGRADSVLSSIILDDTSASTMIPKDAQGLFINQDLKIFQGYWFDDKQL
ncbi:hypothetical protein K0810_06320 [Erysipelothrix rhusiopathiae]|uniref:FtsK/SpoIIIE domain-containing protein n=1 Tax=Erysipelothrix rhusiopathiae TaxID=1648 RepID=UPI000210B59E|nr:FtsK/SpoIIIE domain-containing protein [Erysipelothrix rhusiopathiae]AGN24531.1 putative cell division FtsK/SpoIIIE [Erysipelothrix rhusiopathiae SY1027]AMS10666.1 hypothetical protein A2I91_02470 [Erysipelothrix rhusiopathiae]AOO66992.1 hypothetical protein BC346_01245 [Erysipelothrix rhusiopathiae]AWU41976.1 hypothetical protein DM789_07060 [Erysipelothrix rhusiopathiae]MDE8282863.1 FtsK/SpoIIIE domain-containing protein [Erysipelothrix rhusiopathiae]